MNQRVGESRGGACERKRGLRNGAGLFRKARRNGKTRQRTWVAVVGLVVMVGR